MSRRIFDLFTKVFLIGCMVYYFPGRQVYQDQEMFFQYGVMAFLGLSWFVPRKRELSNAYIGMILIYAVLNTILFHFVPFSRIKLLNLFLGILFIKEFGERLDLNLKPIGNLLALFCAVNMGLMSLQILNLDPIFVSVAPQNMAQTDHVGFLGLKANLGVLASCAFPFIYAASPLASIVCLPLLYMSESSTSVLAFLITALFMMWKRNKKLFWSSLAAFALAGTWYVVFYDMPDGMFHRRLIVWRAGINYLAGSSAWFGLGLGAWSNLQFQTIQENGLPQVWVWAHNEFVQYLFELGVFGCIFLYAYFKNLFKRVDIYNRNHETAILILIPLVINSIFHFPFHIARFALLSCYMIAYIEAFLSEKTRTINRTNGEINEESIFSRSIPHTIAS